MTSMKKRVAATLTAAILAVTLTVPAAAAEAPAIRVSSYKGNTLKAGERSGLIIGPGGTEYSVTSSDPNTVAVEQVMGFWVAVAKAAGSATITVSNSAKENGTLTLTVGSAASPAPVKPARKDDINCTGKESANPAKEDGAGCARENETGCTEKEDARQELIRLINETRREDGVAELPVSEALMTAAQSISDRHYTWHHTKEECEAVIAAGYPYGFGVNLTVFTGVATEETARHALENWLNSPGHFETMIKADCDSIGVGVTESGSVTYCCMFVGRPDTHNPYEQA